MRYSLAFATIVAAVTATDYTNTPCGNLCGNGAAPSKYYTTDTGNVYAFCPGTDFPGHRIDGDPTRSDVPDLEELAELCDAAVGCVAGTLSGGYGYLKDAVPLPYGTADPSGANDSIFKVVGTCGPASTTTTTVAASTTTTTTTVSVPASTTTTTTVPASTTTTTVPATTTTTTKASTTTTTVPVVTTTTTTKASATTTTTTVPVVTTTTTTKATTTTATPSPSCPPEKDIFQIGGRFFFNFGFSSGYRNSFQYADWTSFPSSLSKDAATLKCGDWINAGISGGKNWSPSFQVFQYFDGPGSAWSWHCDASASINFDLNFGTKSNWVKDIFQCNPVPEKCKPQVTTTTVAPPKTTATTIATTTTSKPTPTPWNEWKDCPKRWEVKGSSCNGQKFWFYKFADKTCARNSFQYNWYTTFDPKRISWSDAVDKCADYAAQKAVKSVQKRTGDRSTTWPAFQLFKYNKDGLYHCDTSAVENTDGSFKSSSDVNDIEQWNKVDSRCYKYYW